MKPKLIGSRHYFKSKLTPFQREVIIQALAITFGSLVVIWIAIQLAGYIITGGN